MLLNRGLKKETTAIFKFDGTKVKDLNKQERYLLRSVYGELDDEEVIRCETLSDAYKADFYIIYKGIKKYISFKTGSATTIHQEYLATMLDYFKNEGISEQSLEDFTLFFYRDHTLDGNGSIKYEIKEMVETYPEKARELNDELNADKDFIKRFVERLLFVGRDSNNPEADYICYWREKDFPLIISKRQIFNHIDRKDWKYMSNPHIGPFQFRPHSLIKKGDLYHDKYCHRVDCWWSNFLSDLIYIDNFYRL